MTEKKLSSTLLQKLLPWVVGVVVFWFVSDMFYAPQRDGMSLSQGDIQQYAGMSQDIREHRAQSGEDPRWTGNMFSGMPAWLIDVEYPTQSVKNTVGQLVKVVDGPMNMTLFAMLLMMVAVVLMGMNPWIGIVAGLAYGLSTYFFLIIDAGHITKMWALVYAPPFVASVWYALRRNMWLGSALAALFGSLELGANHPQITYYFLLACIALWLSELWFKFRDHQLPDFARRTALLAVAALLAACSNFSPLWYTAKHQSYTTRGVQHSVTLEDDRAERIAYNTAWSYGREESFNMLVPNYMGESSMAISEDAVRLLQSRGVQEAVFEMAIDDLAVLMQKEMPELTRDDVEYILAQGDPALEEDIYYLYERRFNQLFQLSGKYWGDQPFTAGPTYLGASVLLLALLGLMLTSNRNRWWIVGVSLFALLLAWGSNLMGFYEAMFDLLPGYSKFRTVSMALVVLEWSAPLMAAVAIMELWRPKMSFKALTIRVLLATGVTLLVVVVMTFTADFGADEIDALGNYWWVSQFKEAVIEARRAAFVADAWRTTLYVIATALIVVLYAWFRERGKEPARRYAAYALVAAVAVVVVADMSGVGARYINDTKWSEGQPTELEPTAADLAIMEDGDLGFRVLDLTTDPFNSARASYFHRSVGGYHGAKLGRYQEVIDRYFGSMADYDGNVLAMLNTRYVIYDGSALPLADIFGVEPLGAAWFVEEVLWQPTPRQELEAIGYVDLASEAVVGGDVAVAGSYDASGEIALVEYAPNRLKYEYSAPSESFAVFSEVYFPDGWEVYVDGTKADYVAADYILRGMLLPAGEHTVEWRFEAPQWGMTSTIMGVASWLILLSVVVAVAMLFRREKSKK